MAQSTRSFAGVSLALWLWAARCARVVSSRLTLLSLGIWGMMTPIGRAMRGLSIVVAIALPPVVVLGGRRSSPQRLGGGSRVGCRCAAV